MPGGRVARGAVAATGRFPKGRDGVVRNLRGGRVAHACSHTLHPGHTRAIGVISHVNDLHVIDPDIVIAVDDCMLPRA